MPRWDSDARERLEAAAVELFAERGFDAVTVPDITARAGLTTRTYFRHFVDKREVLFVDADRMPELAAGLVASAPAGLSPLAVIARAVPQIAAAFDGRYEQLQRRKAVIDSHDGLRERELRKMERVVDGMAAAFVARGLDEPTALLVAESAVAVVKSSLRQWFAARGEPLLPELMAAQVARLAAVFAGS